MHGSVASVRCGRTAGPLRLVPLHWLTAGERPPALRTEAGQRVPRPRRDWQPDCRIRRQRDRDGRAQPRHSEAAQVAGRVGGSPPRPVACAPVETPRTKGNASACCWCLFVATARGFRPVGARHGRPAAANGAARAGIVNDANSVTHGRDLRTGTPVWLRRGLPRVPCAPLAESIAVDVAIVGAGVSGALVADALLQAGQSVAALDRRGPVRGSTAASTALLQFELDQPLSLLVRKIGREKAVRGYWRSAVDRRPAARPDRRSRPALRISRSGARSICRATSSTWPSSRSRPSCGRRLGCARGSSIEASCGL